MTTYSRARRLWPLVAILVLAAAVAILKLNDDALAYGELRSIISAGGAHYGPVSPSDLWQRVAERGIRPPGYEFALAAWGAVAGWHHLAARSLSLFAGLLAIACMYRLGRDLASERVGLGAAALLGLSAFYLHYLHEARAYTLFALFSTASVWAYWRVVYRRGGLWASLLLLFTLIGLLYTHEFGILVVLALAVYHLLLAPKHWRWLVVVVLMALALASFWPWARQALATLENGLEQPSEPLGILLALQTVAWSFSSGLLVLVILLVEASILFTKTPRERRVFALAWLWLGCTLGIGLLVHEWRPFIGHASDLIAVWPPLALAAALGLAALARRGLPPVLFLAIWLAAGLWNAVNPAFMRELPGAEPALSWTDLAPALDVLRGQARPDDAVFYYLALSDGGNRVGPVLDHYTEPLGLHYRQLDTLAVTSGNGVSPSRLSALLDGAPRVWLVAAPEDPPSTLMREFGRVVDADYLWCGQPVAHERLTLDFYARRPLPAEEPALRFGNGVGLYVLDPIPAMVNNRIDLLFGWQRDLETQPEAYAFTVSLQDADGNSRGHATEIVPDAAFGCTPLALEVRAGEPGNYSLSVVVRDVVTGTPVEGQSSNGETGTRLTLQTVTLD
nr:MAG: hypothetical protein DIU68_12895 [Chloroflexota bacterium]